MLKKSIFRRFSSKTQNASFPKDTLYSTPNMQCPTYSMHYTKYKRYFKIDQQIARHSVQFSECLLNPPSLLGNSNNYHLFNSRISANHNKG